MTDAHSQAKSRSPKATLLGFLRDETAASAVFFAITLSSTVGIVGLGTEAGLWFAEKRQYQTAADAGAIAGALSIVAQLNADNSATPTLDTSATGQAWTEATRNGASTYSPATSVQLLSSPRRVHVEVSEPKNTMLAAVSSLSSVTINTVAEATIEDLGQPCINGLSNPGTAIEVQGSATVSSPNCVIVSNSTSSGTSTGASDPPAVEIQGGNNAVVNVAGIYTPGSVLTGGSPDMNAPLSGTAPSTGASNPFASVAAPPTTIPTHTVAAAGGTCVPNLLATGGTYTQAGTLCKTSGQQNNAGPVSLSGHSWSSSVNSDVGGNLSIGGTGTSSITTGAGNTYNITGNFSTGAGTTATLPGTFYISGDLTIDSNATLNGTYYVAGKLLIKSGTVTITGALYVSGGISITGGTVAIGHDIYGNDFDISGGTVTLNGTAYVINSGGGSNIGFSVGSGGSISTPTGGTSTIVLSGANAYFDINSNSTVNLTAPTIDSGSPYAGLVMYQDPTSTHTSTIGGSNSTLLGAIYAKSAEVDFAGNGDSACTVIIANIISFTGDSSLNTSGCSNFVSLPTFYKVSLTL